MSPPSTKLPRGGKREKEEALQPSLFPNTKAKTGKRKRQKAGLNKFILDVGLPITYYLLRKSAHSSPLSQLDGDSQGRPVENSYILMFYSSFQLHTLQGFGQDIGCPYEKPALNLDENRCNRFTLKHPERYCFSLYYLPSALKTRRNYQHVSKEKNQWMLMVSKFLLAFPGRDMLGNFST